MGFEMLIILIVIIASVVSFCNLLMKMKYHYETEIAPSANRRNTALRRNTPSFVEIEEGNNSSSIFPDNTLPPPPYTELDLPPKYEDIVAKRSSLPNVHKISLEDNTPKNQDEISIITRVK